MWHYLDASAMVRVVADDPDEAPGQTVLREYFFKHGMYRATSFCVAEALSAFKTKWLRGKISQAEYIRDVKAFFRLVVSALHIEEVPLAVQVHQAAERLIAAYGIDFVDSVQVVTLMSGQYSIFVGDSQSVFITADRTLADAARREGARVWECGTEPCPL
jgi:predicted nucleic acid-binding protein